MGHNKQSVLGGSGKGHHRGSVDQRKTVYGEPYTQTDTVSHVDFISLLSIDRNAKEGYRRRQTDALSNGGELREEDKETLVIVIGSSDIGFLRRSA